jgi:hypothetical protein
MRTVFVEKYGASKVAGKVVMQNLTGAHIDTAGLMWSWPEVKIALLERGATMAKGMAVLGRAEWFERAGKPNADQIKKAVGDF